MSCIAFEKENSDIITNGVRHILCEFLYELSKEYSNLKFADLCGKYLPPDNLLKIENMKDLHECSIKQLQMFLASRGCIHLSGAKKTLISRLWKIVHPYDQEVSEIKNVKWDRKKIDPTKWTSMWAIKEDCVGKEVHCSTPNAKLYKIDEKQSPPMVFFETNKEYIIEGTYDKEKKQIQFGKIPDNFKQEYPQKAKV